MKKKFKVTASTGEITSAFRDNNISEDDVRELVLTITNDGDMYRGIIQSVINNLTRKYKKGNYDRDLAVKAWQYVADEGVRRYDKQFGSGRGSVAWLNPATRRAIAEELRDYYEDIIMYEDDDVNASTTARNKKPVMAADNYGWVVDSNEAWDAYNFACEYFGKEQLDAEIVEGLSTDELAESLAFIFRMNDFQEWYDQNGSSDDDEKDWDEYDFVLEDAEVGFDDFDEEVEYYREHKDELSEDDLGTIYSDAKLLKKDDIAEEVNDFIEEKFYSEDE